MYYRYIGYVSGLARFHFTFKQVTLIPVRKFCYTESVGRPRVVVAGQVPGEVCHVHVTVHIERRQGGLQFRGDVYEICAGGSYG